MGEMFSKDYLINAPDYAVAMKTSVIPELEKIREIRNIAVSDQMILSCSVFRAENEIGTVLIVHGFSENSFKYSTFSIFNPFYEFSGNCSIFSYSEKSALIFIL